jgi:hypothetical protein
MRLIDMHEKLFSKLESLIKTQEGRKLALSNSNPQQLQKIEIMINTLSDVLMQEIDDFNTTRVS